MILTINRALMKLHCTFPQIPLCLTGKMCSQFQKLICTTPERAVTHNTVFFDSINSSKQTLVKSIGEITVVKIFLGRSLSRVLHPSSNLPLFMDPCSPSQLQTSAGKQCNYAKHEQKLSTWASYFLFICSLFNNAFSETRMKKRQVNDEMDLEGSSCNLI